MIYPYTLFLHLIMAFLCAGSLIYLIYNKKNFSVSSLFYYSTWFLFYFLYNVILVLPLLLFKDLNYWSGIFYNFALVSLAFAVWFIFKMALNFLVLDRKKSSNISKLFIIIILLVTSLYFIFPEIPRGSEDGKWVFWYSNRLIAFLYSSFAFIAGWILGFSFLKEFRQISEISLRIRSSILSFISFILPFAAFFYFTAQTKIHLYLAFLISILCLTFLLIANFITKFFK